MEKLRPWWRTLTTHFLRAHYRPDKSDLRPFDGWNDKLYINFEGIEAAFWARFEPFLRCGIEASADRESLSISCQISLEQALLTSVGLALLVFGSHCDLKFEWPEPMLDLPERKIILSPAVVCPDGSWYASADLSDNYLSADGRFLQDENNKVGGVIEQRLVQKQLERKRKMGNEAEQGGENTTTVLAET